MLVMGNTKFGPTPIKNQKTDQLFEHSLKMLQLKLSLKQEIFIKESRQCFSNLERFE